MFFKKGGWVAPGWWLEIDRRQRIYARRLADHLNKKTAKLSPRQIKGYAILIVGGLMGLNVFFMIAAVRERRNARLLAPFGWSEKLVLPKPAAPVIQKGLGHYLDSLQGTPAFDSLLGSRPGLKDTISRLKSLLEEDQ